MQNLQVLIYLYKNLLIYQYKNLLIDSIIRFSIPTNYKCKYYNFFLVITDRLTKIVYYKPIINTIHSPAIFNVIFDVIIWHYSLLDLIVSKRDFLLIFKFWLLLCYFFGIKRRLFIAFYPQINGQVEEKNNIMKIYFWLFVKFK